MRIVIDMQGAQTESRFRGIGRYTMGFVHAIVRNRGEHEIILALSGLLPDSIEPIRAAFDGVLPQENIRVWYAPSPVKEIDSHNHVRRAIAELMREAFIASLQPDVVHITSLFEGYVDDAVTSIGKFDKTTLTSVTLYDLIPLLNPEQYLKPNLGYNNYYRRKIESLKNADLLLAISDYAKQEALVPLAISADRIVSVSTAIEDHFKKLTITPEAASKLLGKFNITKSFILYTGGADERKNLPRLIQAYASLAPELRKQHQLVFAGRMSFNNIEALKAIAKKSGLLTDELIFTGYITEDELIALYNLCQVYIFPSWHEGFGLPVLEAMACGAPVIAANTSSLPEVVGQDDALFDPFSTGSIKQKLELALTGELFCAKLCEHAKQQVKKFSWDITATNAVQAWERGHFKSKLCGEKNINAIEQHYQQSQSFLPGLVQVLAEQSHTPDSLLELSVCLARNFPAIPRCNQLLVDISQLINQDAKTGIQRVVRAILHEWLENPPSGFTVEPIYATSVKHGYRYARKFKAAMLGLPNPEEPDPWVDCYSEDIFIGLDLQHHVVLSQSDLLSDWRNRGVKVFFVVYDLLPISMQDCFASEMKELHIKWLKSITQFDGCLCISKAVADELNEWCILNVKERLRPLAVEWFHLGADLDASTPSKGLPNNVASLLNIFTAAPTFLMVGTLEPRKGHAQVIAAFEQLWQQGININLVLVGKQGWQVDSLVTHLKQHPLASKTLHWLEGISDEFLEKIYANSTCLIAASYGEGFGLPLIEAAQHHISILARDIPVFREVAGECAEFFNADTPEQLAQAIQAWLLKYEQGATRASENMSWLTWQQSAQQLLSKILPST